MPGRYKEPLTAAWLATFNLLTDKQQRFGLSRMCHFMSAQGTPPAAVNDAALAAFLVSMESDGLVDKPRTIHRTACQLWNKAAAEVPGWPDQKVTIPDNRTTYVLARETFPPSFYEDADRYLERLAGKDLLSDMGHRPLRPSSLNTRRIQVNELASAFVHGGGDPATLKSLADLVRMPAVRLVMTFLLNRLGGSATVQTGQLAGLIAAIAKHWVGVDPAEQDKLKKLTKRMTPKQTGLSAKNRGRLRQFDSEANVLALMRLPQQLFADALKSRKSPAKVGRLMQTAIAIELLLMVPIRMENLANLFIGKHLTQSCKRPMHLILDEHEVKNSIPIEVILPDETARMIDAYIRKFRPALCADTCTALFPGRSGGAKSKDMLREQISKCVLERTGLIMNPHLFRHFAAKHFLTANPGAYGTVRLALGHASVNTTTRYYCGTETAAAFRHLDDHVLNKRGASHGKATGSARNKSSRLDTDTSDNRQD